MIDRNILQDTVYQWDQLFSTSWLSFVNKKTVFCCFLMIFFVPMCQIFWHMGTGQRAVPLEPAFWHPLFFLIFSLSAQCVRRFAPISSNLGFGPTKLTLVIFWKLKKKILF